MTLDSWRHDLRLAWRGLRRAPGFAVAAVATLALGMAGTVAMFALIHGVLLRPLPVADEGRLVVGWRALPQAEAQRWPFRMTDLDLLRRESRTLVGLAGVGYNDPIPRPVVESGAATLVSTARVTGGFFEVLGVLPLLGRTLSPRDDVSGAEKVLVLAYGLWQRRYGGSPDVLGRRVFIGEQPFTIVGVMPRDVEHPQGVEAWATIAAMQSTTSNPTFKEAMSSELDLVARLGADVSTTQAGAELRALTPALDAQSGSTVFRGAVPRLQPYREHLVGDVRPTMLALFAAVVLVLLIASANVANLLLVRGASRGPEFTVRAALGANRARLVRHVLAESVVLASAAGALALLIASLAMPAILRWMPEGLPRVDAVRIDAAVVMTSLGFVFIVTALSGMVPALAAGRAALSPGLRDASWGTVGRSRYRGRQTMVVVQVALAVSVVTAAALLGRSLLRLDDVADRLASDQLVHVPLMLPQATYTDRDRQRRFITDLVAQLETMPTIAAVTAVNAVPYTGVGWNVPTFTVEGQSPERARTNPVLNLEEIHPGYFETFEVALVRGRAFTEADREDSTRVAIVSEDVAAWTWPGQDPIGKRLKMGDISSTAPWLTVVGVATPTRYRDIMAPHATLYVPAAQMLGAARDLVIRTSVDVSAIADPVRARVRALDADVEVLPPRRFTELLDVPLARPRFSALLFTLFGAGGLALAAIGLYSVMAAVVRQRRREIGVRFALGATPRDVRRLVVGEASRLVGVGACVGLVLALISTRVLRSLLFEVTPHDPTSLAGALLLLAVAAIVAAYVPVRQASRIDPSVMLRAE
jgi:predicted permease